MEPRFTDTKELADRVRFARRVPGVPGKTVFFVGAGCSINAGVLGSSDIAKRMVGIVAKEVFNIHATTPYESLDHLRMIRPFDNDPLLDNLLPFEPDNIDWLQVYDAMFARYYSGPDDVRELFGGIVEEAGGAINWAHLCLGELVAKRYISTVLTTNFDQLVLAGMVRAGVLPIVCDGLESLNRIAGIARLPQLIELHGSRHSYLLRNRPEDVEAVRRHSTATAAIQAIFQHASVFVAVGYGGREDGVMDLLIKAGEAYPDKHLYWVTKSTSSEQISAKAKAFLATSRNSGLLLDQDADIFFLDLCKSLNVGAPSAIARPLETVERWLKEASSSFSRDPDIRAELEAATGRLAEFSTCLARSLESNPLAQIVHEIRDLRLANNVQQAWLKSLEAMPENSTGDHQSELLIESASTAFAYGYDTNDVEALKRAISLARRVVQLPDLDKDRARWLNQLGNALSATGVLLGRADYLEEAIDVYRSALGCDITDRRRGAALSNLGDNFVSLSRMRDAEPNIALAIASFESAVKFISKENYPIDWARAQTNLGNAYSARGEKVNDVSYYRMALHSYKSALEITTRSAQPHSWSRIQNNIGDVLRLLGARPEVS